jgi:hypothetical protein
LIKHFISQVVNPSAYLGCSLFYQFPQADFVSRPEREESPYPSDDGNEYPEPLGGR